MRVEKMNLRKGAIYYTIILVTVYECLVMRIMLSSLLLYTTAHNTRDVTGVEIIQTQLRKLYNIQSREGVVF